MNISVIKSIVGSSFLKVSGSIISFVTVPLLLKALGTIEYGTWVTLTALIGWLALFDFGSGFSLKNKVTETLVDKDYDSLNVIVAGTIQFYVLTTIVLLMVFGVSLFIMDVLKNNIELSIILYLPIILTFPTGVGSFILQGLKKFNLINLIFFSQSTLWLLIIILNSYGFVNLDIYKIALWYTLFFILSRCLILYKGLQFLNFKFKEVFNITHFKKSKKSLLVGGRFFLLQISSLFLFSIGNIMTYSNLGQANVSQFDTVSKIYLVGMTFFGIFIGVFWSEISHAKALKDKQLLFKIRKQLFFIALIFSLGTIIVSCFMPIIIPIWTKGILQVNFKDLYPFMFLAIIQYFSYCGAVFLNAFEDLKGQVVLSLLGAAIIFPLSLFFFKINIGIGSVPLASAMVILPTLFYVIIKSHKCINTIEEC